MYLLGNVPPMEGNPSKRNKSNPTEEKQETQHVIRRLLNIVYFIQDDLDGINVPKQCIEIRHDRAVWRW